jgi:hypothetical protein
MPNDCAAVVSAEVAVTRWSGRCAQPCPGDFPARHAPAEQPPIEDREALRHVSYAVRTQLCARAALFARSPPGAVIAAYRPSRLFLKTIRIHCRSRRTPGMDVRRRSYRMQPGEAWALNNSTVHGVCRSARSRTHLIAISPASADLLARAERDLGTAEAAVYEARSLKVRSHERFACHCTSPAAAVNECLLRFAPDARQLGYHLPLSLLPAPLLALPVLASYAARGATVMVRIPVATAASNALFRCVSDDGTLDFGTACATSSAWATITRGSIACSACCPIATATPASTECRISLAPIRSGPGFYSFRYMYISPGSGRSRCENLRASFWRFSSALAPVFGRAARIRRTARRNTSATRLARLLRSRACRLVAERDRVQSNA